MKKFQNKQKVDSAIPHNNWHINLPKSFDKYPLGGFSNYVTEIGLITLGQVSLRKPVKDRPIYKSKK
jgi:hypothetical protein